MRKSPLASESVLKLFLLPWSTALRFANGVITPTTHTPVPHTATTGLTGSTAESSWAWVPGTAGVGVTDGTAVAAGTVAVTDIAADTAIVVATDTAAGTVIAVASAVAIEAELLHGPSAVVDTAGAMVVAT